MVWTTEPAWRDCGALYEMTRNPPIPGCQIAAQPGKGFCWTGNDGWGISVEEMCCRCRLKNVNVELDVARRGMAGRGRVGSGLARQGMASYGEAGQGKGPNGAKEAEETNEQTQLKKVRRVRHRNRFPADEVREADAGHGLEPDR